MLDFEGEHDVGWDKRGTEPAENSFSFYGRENSALALCDFCTNVSQIPKWDVKNVGSWVYASCKIATQMSAKS
jgi:hypothetical protein